MALDPGTGSSQGSYGTYVPPPGGGGGANAGAIPPLLSGGYPTYAGGGSPLINSILNPAPVYNTPNYGDILNQIMGPYESAFGAQMSALEAQAAKQRGFAEDAYGLNKEGDQAAYEQYMKQLVATLVGRGLGKSGARNYYSRIRQQALDRQLALLKNSLSSYLYGLTSNVTNARLAGQAGIASQRSSIGMQLPGLYPATVSYPTAVNLTPTDPNYTPNPGIPTRP